MTVPPKFDLSESHEGYFLATIYQQGIEARPSHIIIYITNEYLNAHTLLDFKSQSQAEALIAISTDGKNYPCSQVADGIIRCQRDEFPKVLDFFTNPMKNRENLFMDISGNHLAYVLGHTIKKPAHIQFISIRTTCSEQPHIVLQALEQAEQKYGSPAYGFAVALKANEGYIVDGFKGVIFDRNSHYAYEEIDNLLKDLQNSIMEQGGLYADYVICTDEDTNFVYEVDMMLVFSGYE